MVGTEEGKVVYIKMNEEEENNFKKLFYFVDKNFRDIRTSLREKIKNEFEDSVTYHIETSVFVNKNILFRELYLVKKEDNIKIALVGCDVDEKIAMLIKEYLIFSISYAVYFAYKYNKSFKAVNFDDEVKRKIENSIIIEI